MASKSFIDLTGLQHYDEKLNEKISTEYVNLSGTQTISGAKTFSSTIVGDISGSASKVVATAANGAVEELVRGTMGSNDAFRIAIGGGNNAGYAEIATADDYSEPIYVRQYQGGFATLKRTATLLDGSGNSSFPGTIAATRVNAPVSMYKLDAPATDNINNGIPIGFYSLIDASRSCKTAFLPAANITIEYTIDGGETWLDYGASDAQKQNLFAMTRSGSVSLGKGSSGGSAEMTTDCKLRITFNRTGRYVRVNTLYLYVSDVGHTMNVDLEAAPFSTPDTFSAIRSGVRVSGYSGPNVISFDSRSFGQANANQSSQIYAFRLTFYCTTIGTNKTYYPNVSDIRMYGDVAWNYDNQMMLTDHLYSWDYEKNATFPAKVSAVGLNVGTGAITIDKSNGSNPSTCGILIKGSGQNAAITVSDTGLTKGTDPNANRYMALAFCGKDIDAWTKRVGMVEYHIGAGNVSEISLTAFNCTSNTNNNSCMIKACVDGSGNAYTVAPTPEASDNSTKIATTAFVKAQNYLTSHQSLSNYVTFDGAQTITGVKTFSAMPVLNQVGLSMTVKDTNSDTLRTSQVLHANSPNGQYGINIAFGSGGNCIVGGGEAGTAQLNALAGNSNEHLYLVADGNIYLKPNGNTWANAKQLTITTGGDLAFNVLEATRGTAPSATVERCVADVKDSASNRIGLISTSFKTDMSSLTSIWAYKTTAATGNNIGNLGIGCDASGNVYTVAPTPAVTDNSTKIATTAWARTATGNFACNAATATTATTAATANSIGTNGNPSTATKMYYTVGQPGIGTTTGKAYKGSSSDPTLLSFPENGTVSTESTANIQNLRLMWASSTTYFTDIFVSPNNHYIWHRDVMNGNAYGWRRLVEEDVTGIGSFAWNISIAGNAGTATKATQDASGNVITTTYATKAELNDITSVTTSQIDTLFA